VSHALLGTRFPVSREAVDQALLAGGYWEGQLVHRRRDGGQVVVASRQAIQRHADGTPLAILEINTDITQRTAGEQERLQLAAEQRARQLAERTLDRLARLQRVSAALSLALRPAEVASLVVEHAVDALGARSGIIRIWSETGGPPVVLAERATAGPAPAGDGGRSVDVPLVVDRRTMGELVLDFGAERTLAADERELLDALASQCAQALERARLDELALGTEADLRRSRDQLAAILGGIAEGVTVQDTTGRLVYANDVAAQLSGYATPAALLAAAPGEAVDRFSVFDEAGEPFPAEALPGRRLLLGQPAHEVVLQFRPRLGGDAHWSLVDATPVYDANGHLQLVVNIFRDITERKRQTDAAAFLAEASRLLSESLDPLASLQELADLAVTWAADWCAIDLLAAADGSAGVPERIVAARPGVVLEDALAERISAPIEARGQAFGTLSLAAVGGRRLGQTEQSVVHDLAARAALALDNARLYRDAQEHAQHQAVLNAALRETIDERDRALDDLRQALRTRDEFLASASHDLKNPLASIKATAQLLQRRLDRPGPPDVDRLREGLRRVDAIASRAAMLVEELLDLARMQMGRPLDLERAPTDLVALLREVVTDQQQNTERHTLSLEAGQPSLVGIWDARRLGRVVTNLVDNAVKYSPEGGRVTVAVHQELDPAGQPWACVAVRDEGLGIPADELERIFERFHRARNVETRIGGTGIGLAAARHIVDNHGGSLSVSSQEGVGSTFTLRLPVQAPAPESEGFVS